MGENWFLFEESDPIEYFYNQNSYRLELDVCKNSIIFLGDVGCNLAITGMQILRRICQEFYLHTFSFKLTTMHGSQMATSV